MFILNILYTLFFAIDKMVYYLATVAYMVFYYVSNATILDSRMIRNFTLRVYAILGVLMLFVIAYYLLNYIVNPDKTSDKNFGTSAFIKDVVIALVVMAVLPTIFTKLYSFQNDVLLSGVIPNLILGGATDTTQKNYIEDGANSMVVDVFSAFLTPVGAEYTSLDCVDAKTVNNNQELSVYCKTYNNAKENGDINYFSNLVSQPDKYKYWFLFSTAAGIAVFLFMLNYCLSLGKRVGKMAILQLFAPIPLFMEILPNKKGSRKRWVETLTKTYIEVFVYQFIIFSTIFLIKQLPMAIYNLFTKNWGDFSVHPIVKIFSMIFITMGLLQFAKEAPKMITELLGLKDLGTFDALGVKNLKTTWDTAKGVGNTTAAAASTLHALGSNTFGAAYRNWKHSNPEDGFLKKSGSAIAGFTSGTGRTLTSMFNPDIYKNRKANEEWEAKIASDVMKRKEMRDSGNKEVLYNKLKNVTDKVKRDNKNKPEYLNYQNLASQYGSQFEGYQNRYNALKNANPQFSVDFETYKGTYGNANSTEADFINWMKTDDNAADRNRHAAIIEAYDGMALSESMKKEAEAKMKIAEEKPNKVEDLQLAAQELQELFKSNPDMKKVIDSSGKSLGEEINFIYDKDGNISSDAAILQKVMDKCNDAIKSFEREQKQKTVSSRMMSGSDSKPKKEEPKKDDKK